MANKGLDLPWDREIVVADIAELVDLVAYMCDNEGFGRGVRSWDL